jgi:hypothetical protein
MIQCRNRSQCIVSMEVLLILQAQKICCDMSLVFKLMSFDSANDKRVVIMMMIIKMTMMMMKMTMMTVMMMERAPKALMNAFSNWLQKPDYILVCPDNELIILSTRMSRQHELNRHVHQYEGKKSSLSLHPFACCVHCLENSYHPRKISPFVRMNTLYFHHQL